MKESDCFIAGPIFPKHSTGQCPKGLHTITLADFPVVLWLLFLKELAFTQTELTFPSVLFSIKGDYTRSQLLVKIARLKFMMFSSL